MSNNKKNLTTAQINAINTAIKNGTKISTKGLSGAVLTYVNKYNASIDEKQKAVDAQTKANKVLSVAKQEKADADAEYNIVKGSLSDGQKKALGYSNDVTYVGQNALLDAQLAIQKQINEERQTALSEANENLATQRNVALASRAARDSKGKAILANKEISKYLTDTQKQAIEAGKTVSTAGITNETVLKNDE